MKNRKNLKTVKDISWNRYTVQEQVQNMIKEWINFLEQESFKCERGYTIKWQQAQILKEIFNLNMKKLRRKNE